jgi:iron-sulfur cluster assembly protein
MDARRLALTLPAEGTLLDAVLAQGGDIAHDCEGALACGACRLVVRKGADGLNPAGEDELDMLDRSFAYEDGARLACQATGAGELVEPATSLAADDAVFEAGPVRIAVDPLSLRHVQGTLVDLAPEGLARKLRFDNPNARQSCGCGESFSA